ncbi:aminotransferase [Ancylobacter polymorphus]|uniref:Aminotransferase n=1 Tax=Ancylobacter polymorphus TaxID=223390 RepID=A0A9E7A6M2_9HYPH|nr:aminotransferase [Ancylobacter polymorphus]UOK73858.1 aminotransferase [Ancylobacter polymorphus]
MHTCEPPTEAIDRWLSSNGTIRGRYGHLLLEQKAVTDDDLIDAMRPYFESAHLDAREYFHRQIGIDLHPDADAPGAHACYPSCLPSTARRGLFGEVMAGMVTEAFQAKFVGGHEWCIPIFLFRQHADVEAYLWDLARNPERVRQVFGRFGSDFLGLSLNEDGEVVRFIAGEAKWRQRLTDSAVDSLMLGPWEEDEETGERARSGRGVWFEVNRDTPLPHGLRQLQRLLELRDPDGYQAAILSIDEAVLLEDAPPLPRTNLILIAGNGARDRKPLDVLIGWEEAPVEYTAPHDLQVVELILTDGERLIDGLYSSLWQEAE